MLMTRADVPGCALPVRVLLGLVEKVHKDMALSTLRSQAEMALPDIAESPHQPLDFHFPKRQFGKKEIVSRSFQSSWFKLHSWLHYDKARDVTFCHTCIKVCKEKKLAAAAGVVDQLFIGKGFCYWKNATEKLKSHEALNVHREAVERTISLPKNTEDVGKLLSNFTSKTI